MSEKMHKIYAFICLYYCECMPFPLQDLQCVLPGAAETALLSIRHILCCSNGDFLPLCRCELKLGSDSGLGEPSVVESSHRGSSHVTVGVSLASQVQCCCSSLQKPNLICPLLCLTPVVKLSNCGELHLQRCLNTPLLQHCISLEILYISLIYNRRCCVLEVTEVAALSKPKHSPSPFPVSPAANPIPHVYVC